jgi:hypothetical protein
MWHHAAGVGEVGPASARRARGRWATIGVGLPHESEAGEVCGEADRVGLGLTVMGSSEI